MAKVNYVNQLDDASCDVLIEELTNTYPLIYPDIDGNINKIMLTTGASKPEALEYYVVDSPILWAKVYLNWEARDYQEAILLEGKKAKQLVLRLGRRLGKTDSMCILILWYAYTQINKGPNNQYDILIMTPYETQIDLIFKRLKELIRDSALMTSMIKKSVEHFYELTNGTNILGLTAGANSGAKGGNNSRGQRADLIILDECDYIGSASLTNIINIKNEAPERIKLIAASTPSGKHEEYYKWCTGSTKSYRAKEEDVEKFRFTGYEISSAEERHVTGNGWVEIVAPSIVNKEVLKINPDTGVTYLEDIKNELSEMRYQQEVMAEFGDEELGVYRKEFIEAAIEEGSRSSHKYIDVNDISAINEFKRHRNGPLILGVDWDKVQAGTTMVATYLDKFHINEFGHVEPKFKVLFRVEIPRSQFTYTNAVNKIVELNAKFDFDWIAIDRGYGETQLELLHRYGIENPESGLAEKTIGYQFSEKLDVRDPHTHQIDRKHIKPFMVNNSVITFEKKKIVLDPSDKILIEQLHSYRVERISSTGMPIYSSDNEHAIDAMNLCLLMFEQKYGALFKSIISTRIISHSMIDRQDPVKGRDINYEDQYNKSVASTSMNGSMDLFLRSGNSSSKLGLFGNRRKSFTRRSF